MTLISVLMPSYNAQEMIAETVESVLSQSLTDLELIIIDDGSTDATPEVIGQLAKKDSRIRAHRQKNAGISAARNAALAQAEGRYVACLDSDDLWDMEKLAKQVEVIDGQYDLFVLTGIQTFQGNGSGRKIGSFRNPPVPRGGRYEVEEILKIPDTQMSLMTTALVSKSAMVKLGGWNVGRWTAEDWDLWIRACAGYRFAVIDQPLYWYRKHPGSITTKQRYRDVAAEHEAIVRQARRDGLVSAGSARRALIERRIESSGYFIHMKDIGGTLSVLLRTFLSPEAWVVRRAWGRVVEAVRLFARGS